MKRHGSRRFTRCLTLFACAATLPFAVFAQSVCLIEGGAPTCGEAPDVGSSNKRVERGQHVGNPVDLTTGNKYQRGDDYRALDSPLMFSRHYNSSLVDHDVGLGRGWRHSYDVVLTQASDGSYRIVQSDGRELRFAADASEASNDSTRHASIRDGDGVLDVAERSVWTTAEGRRLTFNGSYLVRIDDTAGRSLSLIYRQRRLAEVQDDDGRVLRLHYAPGSRSLGVYDDANRVPAGHLAWIELPDGSRLVYAYDKHLNLTAVTDPIGERIDYRYDDPDWPSHLTVVAANGNRVGAWNYDESGRAIGWTVSGNRGPVTYLDDARNDEAGQTRVLFWNGRQKDFTWATDVDGSHHVTAINPLPDRLSRHEVVEIFAAAEGLPGFRKTPAETTAGDGELPVGASTQRTLSASPLDAVVNMTLPLSEGPLADGSSIALSVIFDRLGRVHDIGHRGLWARELISRAERMPTRHRKLAESPLSTLSFSTLLERLQATTIPALTTPESIETTIQTLIGAADAIDRDNEQRSREESVRLREQIDPQGAVCPLPHTNDCDDVRDHRDMAELSACAYPRTSCSTRFIRVDPVTLSMDDTHFMIGGFPVHLYLDPVRDRYVLAFRGTGALSDVDDYFEHANNANALPVRGHRLAVGALCSGR